MTKDDIMKMAEQAGLIGPPSRVGYSHEAAERFANLVAAAEREACALICDNRVLYTGYDCATAIRSRGVYKMGWPIGDPREILNQPEQGANHD